MTLSIVPALKSFAREGRSQYYARCWKINVPKSPPLLVRITDAYEQLYIREHILDYQTYLYSPMDGGEGSAKRRVNDFASKNRELKGLISSDLVAASDLRAGFYIGAEVDEFLVDTRLPWLGYVDHAKYRVLGVTFDGQLWELQIGDKVELLSEPSGEYWGPTCRVELFSQGPGKCNASQTGLVRTATIKTSGTPPTRTTFELNISTVMTTGFYDDGQLFWNGGKNAGLISMIKSNFSNTFITIQTPVPFTPEANDPISFLPGCNKQPGISDANGHCKNKFSNLVNFQGEPYIPGRDQASQGIPIEGSNRF